MRVLFVTPYVPSHIRVRSFNLIKSLAKVHEISLVSLLIEDYERAMVKDIEQYCVSVDLVSLPKWRAYLNCLLALPTPTPLRVAYYRSDAFTQRLKEVIRRQKIELVHGELIKVVPALKPLLAEENIPILYDSVDCISWFLQQKCESTQNLLKKAFVYQELQKMRRYEREELVNFHQLIITSESDRDQLNQLICQPRDIQVVSNCVDTGYFTPLPGPRIANSLVFCAKLDYFPNAQAILYFCQNVLPRVWKQFPHIRLTIVGNNPPQVVRALGKDERITVMGYVPDIRPYLGTASVALAPLLVAAGTQFKILEALAMSTPVVTTPRCSYTLGTQHGTHLLVAKDPQEYTDAIVKLVSDPLLAQRLGRMGRQFVVERYNWASATSTLNRLYEAVMIKKDEKYEKCR